MKAFLFTGGEYPGREDFLASRAEGGFIACADSGLDAARAWGIEPDLVVGDMDSLAEPSALDALDPAKVLRLEADKDDTDTEACLKELWRRGFDEVAIVGGGGGRLDHLLAILALFEREPRPAAWLFPGQRAEVLRGSLEYACEPGDTVSVFPLGALPLRMRSEGLRWPLEGLVFGKGYFGVSNRSTGSRARMETLEGTALIIRPYPRREGRNPARDRRLP